MKRLQKLKINELKNDVSMILSNERMRAIKGSGSGLCVTTCSGGYVITTPYWCGECPYGGAIAPCQCS